MTNSPLEFPRTPTSLRAPTLRLLLVLLLGITLWPAASSSPAWGQPMEAAAPTQEYRQAQAALDKGQWRRAAELFRGLADSGGPEADKALYWQAYSHAKLGEAVEATRALDRLERDHPRSAWQDDGQALRLELSGARGSARPVREGASDEVKLMALNSLLHRDPEQALPMVETFFREQRSPSLKEQALFVLAQSGQPRATEILLEVAADDSQGELQGTAIHYLGIYGGKNHLEALDRLYGTVKSVEAKESILHAFMVAGARERLLKVARTESDAELRSSAVHWLGTTGSSDELWQLWAGESSSEVKESILHALFISGDGERLAQVARDASEDSEVREDALHWLGVSGHTDLLWSIYQQDTDEEVRESILHGLFVAGEMDRLESVARDPGTPSELREDAIHWLGVGGADASLLTGLYRDTSDTEVKESILHSLFVQGSAQALVELLRDETDEELQEDAIHWLGQMDSPEAREYLLELLRN